jgi:hypothetical protein
MFPVRRWLPEILLVCAAVACGLSYWRQWDLGTIGSAHIRSDSGWLVLSIGVAHGGVELPVPHAVWLVPLALWNGRRWKRRRDVHGWASEGLCAACGYRRTIGHERCGACGTAFATPWGCPGCGYDLRASPDCCPECGFTPSE